MAREIETDMGASWEAARALQKEAGPIQQGETVVIYGDKYAYQYIGIKADSGLAHVFRPGILEIGEKGWVGKHVNPDDVIHIEIIASAMALNTNIDVSITTGFEDFKKRFEAGEI